MSAAEAEDLWGRIAAADPGLLDEIDEESWPRPPSHSKMPSAEESLLLQLGRVIESGRFDLLDRALRIEPGLALATWKNAHCGGQTLLMAACFHSCEESFERLLPLSDPSARAEDGVDSLCIACGADRGSSKIVRALIEALRPGGPSAVAGGQGGARMGPNAFLEAADSYYGSDEEVGEIIGMLLPWFDLECRYPKTGNTALMCSARGGQRAATRRLLAAGADARAKNFQGETALILAAAMDMAEIVKMLLPVSDVGAVDGHGQGALARAGEQCAPMIRAWVEREELDGEAVDGAKARAPRL